MIPEFLIQHAISPALGLLPASMGSREAVAMCVAIALQESGIQHRRQIGGPAKSYWQFEQGGGVRGVLQHPVSKPYIQNVLSALDYDPASSEMDCYDAIEHNDILAASFARLLLFTLPDALPAQNAAGAGWTVYAKAWRPGKPRRETWDEYFATAWEIV